MDDKMMQVTKIGANLLEIIAPDKPIVMAYGANDLSISGPGPAEKGSAEIPT